MITTIEVLVHGIQALRRRAVALAAPALFAVVLAAGAATAAADAPVAAPAAPAPAAPRRRCRRGRRGRRRRSRLRRGTTSGPRSCSPGAPASSDSSSPTRSARRRRPVVLVIHEVYGLSDWIRAVADRLAADGFIAIAPDMLTGRGPGGGGTEKFASRDDVVRAVRELAPEQVTAALDAAAAYGRALPAASRQARDARLLLGRRAELRLRGGAAGAGRGRRLLRHLARCGGAGAAARPGARVLRRGRRAGERDGRPGGGEGKGAGEDATSPPPIRGRGTVSCASRTAATARTWRRRRRPGRRRWSFSGEKLGVARHGGPDSFETPLTPLCQRGR